MATFVGLHNHTDYSLLRSSSRVRDLVARAKELGMTAIGIADDGNLFAALEFHKACTKVGIQPIIGCDFFLAAESRHARSATDTGLRAGRLLLIAKSDAGYRNLLKLSSAGYTEGFYYRPRIDDELLERHAHDLICLTGSINGDIPRFLLMNQIERAKRRLEFYIRIYGKENVYLELNNHRIPEQQVLRRRLIELGNEYGVGLVAANESYYVREEDAAAHDVLLCIGGNKKRSDESRFRFTTNEFYLKSDTQMRELYADLPEAVENTARIAAECAFDIELPGPLLPEYEIPSEFDSPEAYLTHLAHQGLRERYAPVTGEQTERLEYELGVITSMGFTGYFLIVWDFIRFARENGIPVGPGRGSGAGSLVAYSLRITDIDPLHYSLLFERFLNPDRVSMPDFDIDFCFERRGEVIDYVTRRYGAEKVGQIITFGTLKARAVIRDVARVLDLSFAESDAIAKLVPKDPKIKLHEAIEQVPALAAMREGTDVHAELLEIALKLEGLHRHASTHAAGIVIGRGELTDYVPLYRDPRTGQISTQFTMDQLEECGLVKMDFLGLKTLTLIENTLSLIRRRGVEVDLEEIPDNDPATFEMLGRGASKCVFQFESTGMAAILKRAKPTRIEDLIALNALYRPGPMENIDQFVDSKNGRQPITYPLPQLKSVLEETYGVIVYQEQVMEIVQIVAGFSLGQADILRRAMGKKKRDVMAKMEKDYLAGAQANGIAKKDAESIFHLLEPFAGYGFNKSHAAAYSVLAYKTAYLKANHPHEFMAANLTNEINDSTTFADYMAETRELGITILAPNINLSEKYFTVADDCVVYGMVGIKNVGAAAVDAIVSERDRGGIYRTFLDFLERIDHRTINRKVIETLINAGLFDSLGEDRATLAGNLDRALDYAANRREARLSGQGSLFDPSEDGFRFTYAPVEPWDPIELLRREREILGFYFSGHPLDSYRKRWEETVTLNLQFASRTSTERTHVLMGLLKSVRVIQTKRGGSMAFCQLEDFNGSMELVFFSDVHEQYQELLMEETIIGVVGKVDTSRDRMQFVVESMCTPEELPEKDCGEVHIRVDTNGADDDALRELRAFLYERPGGCHVLLHINGNEHSSEVVVRASSQLMVSSLRETLQEIGTHPRVVEVWKQ